MLNGVTSLRHNASTDQLYPCFWKTHQKTEQPHHSYAIATIGFYLKMNTTSMAPAVTRRPNGTSFTPLSSQPTTTTISSRQMNNRIPFLPTETEGLLLALYPLTLLDNIHLLPHPSILLPSRRRPQLLRPKAQRLQCLLCQIRLVLVFPRAPCIRRPREPRPRRWGRSPEAV